MSDQDEKIHAIIVDAKFKTEASASAPEERVIKVPAHTDKVQVDFRIRPLLTFRQQELAVSVGGDIDKKPLPLAVNNTFIKEGLLKRQSPQDNEKHYIDYNGTYRIVSDRVHVIGTPYAIGFEFQTREPGEYPVTFKVKTENGGGRSAMVCTIIVE